jgi:hypothetical protein
MAIGGKQREERNFEQPKYVGLVEVRVIGINPTAEEFEALLGWAPKEDSKQLEYLGESKDGNTYLRVDVWMEEVKKRKRDDETEVNEKFKVSFYLEDKERENKDNTRKQYINTVGDCSWASDPDDLPDWFKERTYRVAYSGEEELYKFLRTWLSKLDYRNAETMLELEWKKLMRGNVRELREQINGEWAANVVVLATVETVEKESGVGEYQRIYNSAFLSPYSLKFFRAIDYMNPEVQAGLLAKKSTKPHEKFVMKVTHPEYGCKDFYTLRDIELYDSAKNMAASTKVIAEDDGSY